MHEFKEAERYQALQEESMPYVTSVERFGIQKGLAQSHLVGREEGRQEGLRSGLLKGIETGLKLKFGDAGLSLMANIRELPSVDSLQAVLNSLESAATIDDVRSAID